MMTCLPGYECLVAHFTSEEFRVANAVQIAEALV